MRYNNGMKDISDVSFDTGVFGGAFDPVHNQHVALMQSVIRILKLRRLVVLPSGHAPHKRTGTSFEDRVSMLRLATAHIPEVVIDTMERDVAGLTYSSDMLPIMAERYGDFVHIIGGDSMVNMDTWHLPEVVMRYPHAVVARGEADAELLAAIDAAERRYHADITLLPALPSLSSSDVRLFYRLGGVPLASDLSQGAAAHDKNRYFPMQNGVCWDVHTYIRTHRLYDEYAPILCEVPRHISSSRWAHTLEVARMAVRLNVQLHVPEDKVLTAALLHDCMKGAAHVYPAVPQDCRQPAVVHAFNGAEEAAARYGVTDEDILNAIRYHTTGRAAMSDLERLIYLADYCEASRTFAGADAVRQLALSDFDRGFEMAVRMTHAHVDEVGGDICPLGEECYRYYCTQGQS